MSNRFIIVLLLAFNVTAMAQGYDKEQDNHRRNYILQFVDAYKKSYQIMDIDYIETLFGEDALIITEGNKIAKAKDSNIFNNIRVDDKNEYERVIEDKEQYLSRLRKVFKDNQAIRLSIANLKIHPHINYPEIYGLSFLQTWKSMEDSTLLLEDNCPGYIFMMIDFKNGDDCPIIHVRTWQPQNHIKDSSDIYNLYDFIIL